MLDLDQDLDLFKLNGESVIKRIHELTSEPGEPTRAYIMLSTNRVLRESVGWSNKGVMDATFKAIHCFGFL